MCVCFFFACAEYLSSILKPVDRAGLITAHMDGSCDRTTCEALFSSEK